MPETLIRGGIVADGSGSTPAPAEVLIRDGRIAAVEAPGTIPGGEHTVIDAGGLVIAPGFIDVHSHADNAALLDEDDTSKILQGVTTEVVGNCGFSLAPTARETSAAFSSFAQRIFPPIDFRWNAWQQFTQVADLRGYVTNCAPLVGHGTLRIAALGMADVRPDEAQLRTMGELLDSALEGGAFGMSSGLVYPPAMFSETAELSALAAHLGQDGLYTTHMRGEGDTLLSSIAEAIEIGTSGRTRVHISHLKAAGQRNWGSMSTALDRIHSALDGGLSITKDVYPYTAASTMLTALLPPPFLADGDAGVLARLESEDALRQLAKAMESGLAGWDSHLASAGWDGVLVSTTASHHYEGQTIAELAVTLDQPPLDVLVRILREERLHASMVLFSMNEADVTMALADTDTMIGSDGLPPGSGGKPHPRMLGTFPRVLAEYVRNRSVLPLGEAIRRMTSLSAKTFRIPERGSIRKGFIADLVAFDPDTVNHTCDYRDPVHIPRGIPWVMQAGEMVVDDSVYLGKRRGRRLTPA